MMILPNNLPQLPLWNSLGTALRNVTPSLGGSGDCKEVVAIKGLNKYTWRVSIRIKAPALPRTLGRVHLKEAYRHHAEG